MKKILLASTSTLFGEEYLAYLLPVLQNHFQGVSELLFIPYAQPSGISLDAYTQKVADAFQPLNIKVKGLHQFENQLEAIRNAQAVFTGGGNTFLLLKTLYDLGLMSVLKQTIEKSTPYLGCSAGSNLAGLTINNTNDMPIVYPPSFETLGLIPFNLNPHYLDPIPDLKHNGETRETRIKEFLNLSKIPVVGLREGSWLEIHGEVVTLRGNYTARIFESIDKIYEVESGSILKFNE